MTTNLQSPEIGTVIHATLLPYDLIPAFMGALPSELRGKLDLSDELLSMMDGASWIVEDDSDEFNVYEGTENPVWDMETIQDALSEYAADYGMYFGTTDGDGSDFGFWYAVSDDDYTFTPCGQLGGQIAVSSEIEYIGTYSCMAEALDAVTARMEAEQYWPSLWWISDHGDLWPIDQEGNEIK